jgi:hypothetical protein
MAKVLTHVCMSLDGFVAQPDDNPAELFSARSEGVEPPTFWSVARRSIH